MSDLDLDLANPMGIRAEMARRGFAPARMVPYEDPERGYVDPLDDEEARGLVWRFMGALWRACLAAEEASRG